MMLSLMLTKAYTQDLYLNDGNNQLFVLQPETCTLDSLADMSSFFLDISYHPNGELYGIRGNGELFQVDTTDGSITLIHTFDNQTYSSMTTSHDGHFYITGSSGELRSYDLASQEEILHGIIDAQVGGDLTFIAGELYLGGLGARLYCIDLDDPSNTELVVQMDTPGKVIGLTSIPIGCDSMVHYAVVSGLSGGISTIYQVDFDQNSSVLVCTLPFAVKGSAATFEYLGSLDSLPALVLDSITYELPLCTDPFTDLHVFVSNGAGELNYQLSDSLSNTDGMFNGLVAEDYTLSVVDDRSCTLQETITISCEEVNSTGPRLHPGEAISLFPNPTTNDLHIHTGYSLSQEDLRMYSITGQELPLSVTSLVNGASLELQAIAAGTYFLQLPNSTHRVIVIK